MHKRRLMLLVALVLAPRYAWPQGNPLGPEFRVNTFTTGSQGGSGGYDCPCENGSSVAADSAGNFVVVWHSNGQDGSESGIFGQRYARGGAPMGPEFRVNTYTTNSQSYPAVAVDPAGNFVIVWHSHGQDGSGSGIFGQRYSSAGLPLGSEFRVNRYGTGFQLFPSVAADGSGRFVIAWMHGANKPITARRYDSTGAPLGREFAVSTPFGGPSYPSVAAGPEGDIIVAWQSYQDGSGLGVVARGFDSSGEPLGDEFRVNTYTTGNQMYSSVAKDSLGNFVVVWNSIAPDHLTWRVVGQRYDSSAVPQGSEFQIDTAEGWHPEVDTDAAGNFVVVWTGEDGYFSGVMARRYDSSGSPLGSEFPVNTYTAQNQRNAVVAAEGGPSGNYVVAWQSLGQDGSDWGVFGQRHGPIVAIDPTEVPIE